MEIGLYIHIPFCRSKCSYCDFVSFASSEDKITQYVDVLCHEIEGYSEKRKVDSIFIGGGTPSLLNPEQLRQIFFSLRRNFDIDKNSEISIEANPGTLNSDFLQAMKDLGINRLSLGAQNHDEKILKILGRIHIWNDVAESVLLAKEYGIDNINIDLMLGLPFQTLDGAKKTLDEALKLPITHISCYGLIIEEGTRLKIELDKGLYTLPEADIEADMYEYYRKTLKQNGFFQYEVSNFAINGYECRHNIGYWERRPYIGFGLAAHSLIDEYTRYENTDNLAGYLAGEKGKFTKLEEKERIFEALMLGFRMNRGIEISKFNRRYNVELLDKYKTAIKKWEQKGLLEIFDNKYIRLSQKGMPLMNSVLLDLMD